MADRPSAGSFFGVPYNFDRPSLRRLLSAYWQPNAGMLVEKPFGIGYTLNLANWRSWVVLAVVGVLLARERSAAREAGRAADEPVEVVVED